jgi:hypothetical protein
MVLWSSRLVRSAVGFVVLIASFLAAPESGDSAGSNSRAQPQPAERLVIRYTQASFELISRTPLEKTVPPSIALPDSLGRVSGYWFELQSESGVVVYRRRTHAPDIVYTETPMASNPTRLTRAETVVPENTLTVLIPRKAEGESLVFFGPPPGAEKRIVASGEIGRVRLR